MLRDVVRDLASTNERRVVASCERLVDVVEQRELEPREIADLALSIASSGIALSLDARNSALADVPSSGAPGSLSTLLCPYLLVACGVRVPKISASGSVAGGIDTLAMLPGFRAELDDQEAASLLDRVGIFHTLQSPRLCPADRVLVDVRRRRAMMANPSLAAVSLLSKKLAVRGTHAVFDFRVGSEGNIGVDFPEARHAARLLLRAASELRLSVAVVLTDNRSSPTTAIGRLESLRLLWEALSGSLTAGLDLRHVEVCVELAARAVALAREQAFTAKQVAEVAEGLASGRAMNAFIQHVAAQGAATDPGRFVADALSAQTVELVTSDEEGLWFPPPLGDLKKFAKDRSRAGDPGIGYRCVVMPGAQVSRNQPVAQVRSKIPLALPPGLRGATVAGAFQYLDAEVVGANYVATDDGSMDAGV